MLSFKKDTPIAKYKGEYYLRPEACITITYSEYQLSAIARIVMMKTNNCHPVNIEDISIDDITRTELSSREIVEMGIAACECGWSIMKGFAKATMAGLVSSVNNRKEIFDLPIESLYLLGFKTTEIHCFRRADINKIGDIYDTNNCESNDRVVFMRGVGSSTLLEIQNKISGCLTIEDRITLINTINKRSDISFELGYNFRPNGLICRVNGELVVNIDYDGKQQFSDYIVSGIRKIAKVVGKYYFPINSEITFETFEKAGLDVAEVVALGLLFRNTWEVMYSYAWVMIHKYVSDEYYHFDVMELDIKALLLLNVKPSMLRSLRKCKIYTVGDIFTFEGDGINYALLVDREPNPSALMELYTHLHGFLKDIEKDCFLKTVTKKIAEKELRKKRPNIHTDLAESVVI